MGTFRVSEEARQVWRVAARVARSQGEPFVDTDHLLLAILEDEGGVASRSLAAAGVPPGDIRRRLGVRRGAGEDASWPLPTTPEAVAVLYLAPQEAAELGDEQIKPEHLLLALCRHRRGVARIVLGDELGVSTGVLRRAILSVRS